VRGDGYRSVSPRESYSLGPEDVDTLTLMYCPQTREPFRASLALVASSTVAKVANARGLAAIACTTRRVSLPYLLRMSESSFRLGDRL
jgi:hypothetical protein